MSLTSCAALAAAQTPLWAAGSDPYGGFSGNKDHKYVKALATDYDFGLTPEEEERAKELHAKIVVFDNLAEVCFYPEFIDNCKAGGVTAGNMTLGLADMFGFTPEKSIQPEQFWSWEALKLDLARLPSLARTFGDDLMITYNHADILQAKKEGKVGIFPGAQNTTFIGRDVSRLKQAYDMGLRISQLSYNDSNFIASGSAEKPEAQFGLSALGERVVGTMNDLGMLVDTGHCSSPTMMRAAEVSEKPISVSHAGMRSKVDQFRSITDEAFKVVADKGGVLGILSTPSALNGTDRCTVDDYLDNIEHAVNVGGIDHVGYASDFSIPLTIDHIFSLPGWDPEVAARIGDFAVWPWSDGHVGYENNSGAINLTRGLVKRGYSDEDIAKIMGGNWMRLIADTVG
ncbi:MAG: hypothetical protein GJ676_14255 [Rhodobacteraceae bacterium]|nr:hypothetical protein [Paracoccaceae bacterium]